MFKILELQIKIFCMKTYKVFKIFTKTFQNIFKKNMWKLLSHTQT